MDIIARGMDQNGLKNSLLTTHANPNYRKYVPCFRETFGDMTRWDSAGYGINTDDTVNYSAYGIDKRENGAWVKTTGHSLKLTKTITSITTCKMLNTFVTPIDLTDKHGLLRYFIHEGSGLSTYWNLGSVYVQLIDVAGVVAYWADFGNTSVLPALPALRPGWRTKGLPCNRFDIKGTNFDITQVKKIQISILTKAGFETSTPSVTFDFLEFFPKIKTPIPYVVTMDGGYTAQKDALAYLTARGIRAHVYVTYDNIGSIGYMTLDDLKQAQFMGHTIDVHERGLAPVGWATMAQSQKEQSLEDALNWKLKNGFSGKGFAPLGTQWYSDDDTLNTFMPYLQHIRLGGMYAPWNPRVLNVSYDTNAMTVADEVIARQAAIANGEFYIGLVHSLVGTFTLANFKTIIDAGIADTNVKFVTVTELIETNWYA